MLPLSRLRGRAGVGVLPRVTPPEWREPSTRRAIALPARADLPRKREREEAAFALIPKSAVDTVPRDSKPPAKA